MRNKAKCLNCDEVYYMGGQGLCTRCYPKISARGEFESFPLKRELKSRVVLVEKICSSYEAGATAAEIGNRFGYTERGIRHILGTNNVSMRRTGYARRVPLNENTFDDMDTQGKWYWLGFIYADGYVSRGELKVHLHLKDVDHMEKLKHFLDSGAKVRIPSAKGRKTCAIQMSSAHMCRALRSLGVVVGRNKFHLTAESMSPQYESHFLRGYLDGDGTLRKNSKPNVGFIGQDDILSWISDVATRRVGAAPRNFYPTKSDKVNTIRFNGIYLAMDLLDFIYDDAQVFLPRKHRIYEEWKQSYPSRSLL